MSLLQGKHIKLRALEITDLEFLFNVENNTKFWEVSSTQTPFSKYLLERYIENTHQDIYTAKQVRFLIESTQNEPVGMIDLFDFNPQHKRAGIGVLILEQYQNKNYASEALQLLIEYSFSILDLRQLYANITTDNEASLKLFKKFNFAKVGVKQDWIFSNGTFKDEILLQLLKK